MRKTKYLMAAALVALCAVLASGAAFAQDSWAVADQDFPASLTWDAAADVSVDASNDGTTTWDSSYALVSVEGVTGAASEVDTWGLTYVPVSGVTVGPTESYLFEFTITAPPITTLEYELPITVTTPGVVATLDCNWILASQVTPTVAMVATDTAANDITVGRFADILPGTGNDWAAFWIEELAGRVPLVVAGYDPITYGPIIAVSRDQMAVFMARALKLDLPTYQGTFDDVPEDYWARPWIEALALAGIVQGYDPVTYAPAVVVSRDQMAAFVARGIAGSDEAVPSGPATATFDDVPTDHWACKYVEYCVANDVVQGYDLVTYAPTVSVSRDQMAVFVYRGFIRSTGTAVILGGPAVTAVNPQTATYDGWSSLREGPAADPGYAYVVFDACRFGPNLVFPHVPSGTWDIKFELRDAADPDTAASGDYAALVLLTPSEITAAASAANSSGFVYYSVSWDIPAGLAPGDYVLVASVADGTGTLGELDRRPSFTITP